MDQSLAYLHEVLSNYVEEYQAVRDIDYRLKSKNYQTEEEFAQELSQEDILMLTQILNKEMHHANESGDHERGYQLNEVYEQLF